MASTAHATPTVTHNNGKALRCASKRLQDDEGVVTVAVTHNCFALWHASERLQTNENVLRTAVTHHGDFLYTVEREDLKDDKEDTVLRKTGRECCQTNTCGANQL